MRRRAREIPDESTRAAAITAEDAARFGAGRNRTEEAAQALDAWWRDGGTLLLRSDRTLPLFAGADMFGLPAPAFAEPGFASAADLELTRD